MKRSIQATLTGEAFKAKPVYGESSVGSGNQTLYCEFVDAFCRVSPRSCAVAISEAQDEWRKVRSNPADVRRRIDELNAMAQKAKCASGWKVTISASPQPSSSSNRLASDRSSSLSASARLSVECSFLEEARSVKTTSCTQNLYFLVSKNFFHVCLYAFNVCVRLEGGGGGERVQLKRTSFLLNKMSIIGNGPLVKIIMVFKSPGVVSDPFLYICRFDTTLTSWAPY